MERRSEIFWEKKNSLLCREKSIKKKQEKIVSETSWMLEKERLK